MKEAGGPRESRKSRFNISSDIFPRLLQMVTWGSFWKTSTLPLSPWKSVSYMDLGEKISVIALDKFQSK